MTAVRQPIRNAVRAGPIPWRNPLSNATTTRRLALNIPLIVLWVAAVAVAALGYFLLQSGNAAQADFYNTQGSDYLQFLNLQTQSTLGGLLLTAGVVGVFIALATHARNHAAAVIAANAAVIEEADTWDLDEVDESDVETVYEPSAAPEAASSEVTDEVAPVTAEAETAETAETATPSKSETAGPDETSPRA
jgi:hypothetical protein